MMLCSIVDNTCKRCEWREEEVTFVLVIPRLIIYLLPIV